MLTGRFGELTIVLFWHQPPEDVLTGRIDAKEANSIRKDGNSAETHSDCILRSMAKRECRRTPAAWSKFSGLSY